ncbi:hypothetical protein EVAR_61601_1 [Eumeta japonica]|uniref:Uncharacterized protein n=1 Tax=Eumeta variegata TaxID=151549 RepID=A0A4C1YGT5_EUMVA|nr:hypothetical protein EVAR_61601_1 [Eumeta japonica]
MLKICRSQRDYSMKIDRLNPTFSKNTDVKYKASAVAFHPMSESYGAKLEEELDSPRRRAGNSGCIAPPTISTARGSAAEGEIASVILVQFRLRVRRNEM